MAIDGVKPSPYRLVFRKLVALLQADPVLKRTIKSWHVFAGQQSDTEDFAEGEFPGLRILPFAQGASPESETTQNTSLGVRIELAVDGFNLDDLLDLWGAIEASLFKGDGTAAAFSALQTALAGTGASVIDGPRLTQPAITPNATNLPQGVLYAAGIISVGLLVMK